MPLVVGVTFRRVGKVYYFDPGELELNEDDYVIAETARGVEFGEVVLAPRSVPEEELVAPLKNIIRVATGDDMERETANRAKEKNAYDVCERKILEHNLPMKLLEAEYAFDGSQITFSFSADGRIDFRELVKDVAGILKTKVQLHQIGVRDEAKLIGGYGTCGRSLCCATFLSNFDPISMKMAKDQSLFLNPAKFSGACGKLMCCLRYEHDFYKQAQKMLPAVGAVIPLEHGKGKVIDVNVVSNVITVATEDDVQLHIQASEIKLTGLCRKHGIACNMSEPNCEPLRPDADISEIPIDNDVEDDADSVLDAEIEEIEWPKIDRPVIAAEPEPEPEPKPEPLRIEDIIDDAAEEVAHVTMWRKPGSAETTTEQEAPSGSETRKGDAGDKPKKGGNGSQNRRRNGRHPHQGNRRQGNGGNNRRGNNGGQHRNKPGSEPKSEYISIMPIYEFECNPCKDKFEILTSPSRISEVKCPKCGGSDIRRIYSPFFSKTSSSSSSSHGSGCAQCASGHCGSCGCQ